MDVTKLIFGIVGGLGLFIYGIHLMSAGLQKIAGSKIRIILSKLTSNRFMGVLVGASTTALIQSSSATTVTVVGFINAGLMSLTQAVSVIIGANIGTTITAQLIAFKITKLSLPIVGFGAFFYLFGRKKKHKNIGEAIFGFGLLFLGLAIMGDVVKPLAASNNVKEMFLMFGHNPLLGVIAGMIVTEIVQSSSVTTGIIITLASAGLLDLNAAIPLVFGTNIGTCITAVIASIKTTVSAKRAALAHIGFNVIGTFIALFILPFYLYLAKILSNDIARQIANTHTLFNVVNTLIFLPVLPLYAKMVTKIIPGKDIAIRKGPRYMDKALLKTPTIALSAVKKEITRMTKLVEEMVDDAMNGFYENNLKQNQKVIAKEDAIDELQSLITDYLVELTQRELSTSQSQSIPSLLHSVNDLERIGDHAVNITELTEKKVEDKLVFSPTAIKEIRTMHNNINQMFAHVITALNTSSLKEAKHVLKIEGKVNTDTINYRQTHAQRLNDRKCNVFSGIVFLDLIMNFEKVGDHLTNIAQALLDKLKPRNDTIY
jgi:phosphate:Na+ symporter